MNHSS